MNARFDPARSAAISAMLAEVVTPKRRRAPRVIVSAALVSLGLVVGATVSAAAINLSEPTAVDAAVDQNPGVDAPPGYWPGQPIVSVLGELKTTRTVGEASIILDPPPTGAMVLRVTMTCVSLGEFWVEFDSDLHQFGGCIIGPDGEPATSSSEQQVDDRLRELHVSAAPDFELIISYQYLSYIETKWGVNDLGETYGVVKYEGVPDLQLYFLDESGEHTGYMRNAEWEMFSPDWPVYPTTEQLAQATRDRLERYPDGWDISIYESDGVTVVGTAHVQYDANGRTLD